MNSQDKTKKAAKVAKKSHHYIGRVMHWFQFKWSQLRRGLTNYLKSKTRNFPSVPPKPRRKVVEEVVKSAVFKQAIEPFAQQTGFSMEQVQDKARGYVKEIASDLNYLAIPLWDLVLSWVFKRIYDGISIDTASLQKLRDKVGQAPIVFVPNHRSHMDYILLSYIFYYNDLPMPYVCAGNNMNFWPFGGLFRKSGAFYIRRSFEGNRLYQATLYAYLHYLLKEKALLEFFIEGTRSRSGKLLPPRFGILSLLMKAYQEQADIPDILFVPTAIVYETVIEEDAYTREMEGATKKRETFWDVLRIRKYLRRRYGKVNVRFGEPVSLAAFEGKNPDYERTDVVPRFAGQINHDINRNTVVTPSALVACALLANPHAVTTKQEVLQRIERFRRYLEFKRSPVTDLLQQHPEEAIEAAVQKYTHDRLLRRYDDEEGTFFRIRSRRRRVLEYYKNTGVHFFVSAAAVSAVMLSWQDVRVTPKTIEAEVVFLRDLLADEFRFASRRNLSDHLKTVLDFLSRQEAIRGDEKSGYEPGAKPDYLYDFRSLLDSTLAAYWAVLGSFDRKPDKMWAEAELIESLLRRAQLRLLRHRIFRHEALSPFTVRNILQTCTRLGILSEKKESQGKRVRRSYEVTSEVERLGTLLTHLEKYLVVH